MVEFTESGLPITEADLKQAEAEMNKTLPESYRRFLLQHNGGRPSQKYFPLTGDPRDTHGMLEWLFPIERGNVYDLVTGNLFLDGRLPDHLVAIGADPGGNQICLSVAGDDLGKVYFWDHEDEVEEGETPDDHNVYLIANSFAEFLNGLKAETTPVS